MIVLTKYLPTKIIATIVTIIATIVTITNIRPGKVTSQATKRKPRRLQSPDQVVMT